MNSQTLQMKTVGHVEKHQVNLLYLSTGVRYMLSLGIAIHHSDNALNAGVLITHISLFEDGIKNSQD